MENSKLVLDTNFSVVMPVYNVGNSFLREAIESVLTQTLANFELIIVDDGSTDGSDRVLEWFTARDNRIQLIKQSNAGPAAAMNKGISVAIGSWVVVMHGDDVMKPNRLSVIGETLQAKYGNIGVITAGVELISDDGRVLGRAKPDLPTNPFFLDGDHSRLIVGGLYHTAISRQALKAVGGYSVICRVNEDVDLYNRIVESGYGIMIIDANLMQYRIHEDSASSSKARELRVHWRFLKEQIRCRRSGVKQEEWAAFIQKRKCRSLLKKSNEYRKDSGRIYYRNAATAFGAKKWITMAVNSLASLLLTPKFFICRWWDRTQKTN